MWPLSKPSTPQMQLKSDVLPAPLGPISPLISSRWTLNDTSLSACTPP